MVAKMNVQAKRHSILETYKWIKQKLVMADSPEPANGDKRLAEARQDSLLLTNWSDSAKKLVDFRDEIRVGTVYRADAKVYS